MGQCQERLFAGTTWRPVRVSFAPQAQGLWRMLQGKPKDEEEEQRQRAQRDRQENLKTDSEWASGGASGEA